jgi:hypothetical protein
MRPGVPRRRNGIIVGKDLMVVQRGEGETIMKLKLLLVVTNDSSWHQLWTGTTQKRTYAISAKKN